MTLFLTKCRVCGKTVLVATDSFKHHEYFEVAETKVLVVVGIGAGKRITLEACEKVEPFHGPGKEPDICFAHAKHGCLPPAPGLQGNTSMDITTGTSMTNAGQLPLGGFPTPAVPPANMPSPAPSPIRHGEVVG